jgi:hypothetical protein
MPLDDGTLLDFDEIFEPTNPEWIRDAKERGNFSIVFCYITFEPNICSSIKFEIFFRNLYLVLLLK